MAVPARDHLASQSEPLSGAVVRRTVLEPDPAPAFEEAAPRRARSLMKITAALADAVTADQVFDAVVDEIVAALGASSGGLWMADEEGRTASLVRAVGYHDQASFGTSPLDRRGAMPALDTILDGEPIFLGSQGELLDRYPHLASVVTPGRSYCVACLPVGMRGRTLGVLGLTFEGAPPMDDEQRGFLMLVARYAGQALERLRLLDAERRSRARAEASAARTELLYRLARAVIDAGGAADVFEAALDAIGEALGTGRASILVFDAGGVMRFRAWRGLSERYRRAVEGHSPWARDAKGAAPIVVPDVEEDASLSSYLPLFREERVGALAFVPLVASGALLGKFMVYYPERREFASHEIDLAMAIANHVAAAIARFAAVGELERTVRFNEMFTAVLGHDLRNPLAGIMSAAQLALKREQGERVATPLRRILRSGGRMARMIDEILDFSRVRAGAGIPLRRGQVDLVPLLRQVIDELDATSAADVALEHTGDTVGAWDEDRLCQVFSNLVGNAVQHGAPGHGVRVRADGADGDVVRVEVHNMGAVPAEVLPRLFEPMTGGERRREKARGLGLGLFITQQIAAAHGGSVAVSSSEAAGTTFTVSLPRRPAARESVP
jgi:signal transduction histidine kinase